MLVRHDHDDPKYEDNVDGEENDNVCLFVNIIVNKCHDERDHDGSSDRILKIVAMQFITN